MLCRRLIVIHQNAIARPFKVIELAALGRPPENDADGERDQHTQRDQQNQNFHICNQPRLRRNEFATTMSELDAMPMAAHAGEINPPIASGTAITL